MSDPNTIRGGSYALDLDCPDCDRTVTFPIEIKAELRILGDSGGKLRPVVSVKSQEHNCNGEQQPPMFEGNGAAAAPEMSDR